MEEKILENEEISTEETSSQKSLLEEIQELNSHVPVVSYNGYIKKINVSEDQLKKSGVTFGRVLGSVLIYTFLILFALWTLFPVLIGFFISFTPDAHLSETVSVIIPKELDFTNYRRLLVLDNNVTNNQTIPFTNGAQMPRILYAFCFTCVLVLPTTIIGLFTSAMSAFAYAKLNFKGKNFMFGLLLFTMMIPGSISLVPAFSIYQSLFKLGLPQFFPLFVPGMFGAAGAVFFLKQFFSGIPTDLMEAAKLDGMGYFSMFFKIIVPLSGAALIAQGILGFVGGYNDYFGPLLYLNNREFETLQLCLTKMQAAYADYPARLMTACMLALLPTLVIYLFAQRFFVEGIATSGMKI